MAVAVSGPCHQEHNDFNNADDSAPSFLEACSFVHLLVCLFVFVHSIGPRTQSRANVIGN